MGLSAWNAYRAKEIERQKALEQSKFLDNVVVEPTSPESVGEVGTLPTKAEQVASDKPVEEEVVKLKKKKK